MRDTSQTTNASSDEEDAEALESTAQADEGAHARAESLASSAPGLEEAMRRAARATTTSTVRLAGNRRFTLPESAPIMRQVMGFLGDQARTLLRAGLIALVSASIRAPALENMPMRTWLSSAPLPKWCLWAIQSCVLFRGNGL